MSYDFSTDKIDFGVISAVTSTAYSILAWINTDTNGDGNRTFFSTGDGANFQTLFRQEGSKLILYHRDGTNRTVFENAALTVGFWHRVAATWDGSNLRLYRDGALKDTTASVSQENPHNDSNGIGYQRSANVEFWDGRVAHVIFINNVALSLNEIETTLWRGPARPVSRYYPLFDSAVDLSGNADTGVITGAVVADHAPVAPPFGFDLGWRGISAAVVAAGFSPLQIGQARTLPSDPGGMPLGW